ncbi:hypothetical protein HW115_15110 [Verrucomicrobiaceae bacterium N1E253]|uniref:Lipoprotein n=1 Tax=Oceaniferula marina TaxID=2748318 RepID=A0A851GQ50_9BACT|nr:hypothetical protein [Oceaniferula marina]NWK56950.1 hypothetical protein [Oceaniferula marina]
MNDSFNQHLVLGRVVSMVMVLALSACSSKPYFKERSLHASYKDSPATNMLITKKTVSYTI